MRPLDSIESAIEDLRLGRMIIVVDDEDRENEGDFLMAAEAVTPAHVNFMATHGRGMICAPITPERARELELPLQVQVNTASLGTAFTVTVDAAHGISTGISAADRSHTLQLIAKGGKASDLARPGHIFPLIAKSGGVLERNGHTEAAVDFARLAGFTPTGVICEVMNEDGTMARYDELAALADKFNLKMVSIADLITYRKLHENLIDQHETIPFANKWGEFELHIFRSTLLKEEHIAIVKGGAFQELSPLIRVHSECFTGDIFGSRRCDCGPQLEKAMELMQQEGAGVLVYLRQEGRGIGLFNKIKAYKLQDQGMDTVEANLHLGFPADARNYAMAAQILRFLKVDKARLLTNNPLKLSALKELGFNNIERAPLEIAPHEKNAFYLLTKKSKLGHLLGDNFGH